MRTLKQLGWILALSLCLLLPFAGCGGDDTPAPTATSGGLRARDSGTDSTPAPATAGGEGWGMLKGTFVYQGDPPQLSYDMPLAPNGRRAGTGPWELPH